MARHRTAVRLTLLGAAVAALAGCGAADRLRVHPTRGQVLVRGEPAGGARVFFHPAAGLGDPRGLRPFAVAEADGTFRATTYLVADGAPEGEYVVTVTWPARPNAGDEGPEADRLRGQYADPKMSKLRATVRPGDNPLEPFRLN